MTATSAATGSPLLARRGAVAGEGIDAAVAAHYGDPLGEQRRLINGQPAVVDRSHRDVVEVAGPDRLAWLHSLVSQHLETLPPGEGREALLLSPHGHVEQHMVVSDDGSVCRIDLEPGQAEPFSSYLDRMRFMLRVEVSDQTQAVAVVTVVNPPEGFHTGGVPALLVERRMPWGADLLLRRDGLAEAVDDLGLPLVGHGAFEALRVADRRPRFGFETDHRTIPHELGWIGSAVHLDKGCYRGQETVARVHNLGRPPRRLALLHLDGSREHLPAVGAQVMAGDRAVGFLGTAAWHAELGQIALALIKRQVTDDSALTVDGVSALIDPA